MRLAILTLLVALVLAACGGGGGSSDEITLDTADVVVRAQAPPGALTFDAQEYVVAANEAGEYAIAYVNDDFQRHTLRIDGPFDLDLEVSGEGDVDTGTVALAPGRYVLYCDVPGHREIGMEATLVIG